jgi:hypothetical protein
MSYRLCFSDPYGSRLSDYTRSGLRYSDEYATKREAVVALKRYMQPTAERPYPCAWISEDVQSPKS